MSDTNQTRAKFHQFGTAALTDNELITLLLSDELSIDSKALLSRFGGIVSLFNATYTELKNHIAEEDAMRLKVVMRLNERLSEQALALTPLLNNTSQLSDFFRHKLAKFKQEHICCVLLDAQLRLIDAKTYPSINAKQIVFPLRDILSTALNSNTHAIAIAHNHPAGQAVPSNADIAATHALVGHFRAVDIELTDHIIIAHNDSFSFRQERLLN